MFKKTMKYFASHPLYTAMVHLIGGIGIGILIAGPFIAPHPVRWGGLLVGIALLGHIYPLLAKK